MLSQHKSNLIKLLIISFSGVLIYSIEVFLYPDAGRYKENKAITIRLHSDLLHISLLNTIYRIKENNLYADVSITKKEKKLDNEFFSKLRDYHQEIRNLLYIIRKLGKVSIVIMEEEESILKKISHKLTEEEMNEILKVQEDFLKLSKSLINKER